jgi:hypothetical protein
MLCYRIFRYSDLKISLVTSMDAYRIISKTVGVGEGDAEN